MTQQSTFETAANPDLYDTQSVQTAQDLACADFIQALAKLIPHNPADNIIPDELRNLCLDTMGVTPSSGMGAEFADAFQALTKIATETTSLDGNKNVCLAMNAHSKLLDGFVAFNKAQDILPLTGTGERHFADRIRARQVYWDMAGHGVASVTMPNPTGYR